MKWTALALVAVASVVLAIPVHAQQTTTSPLCSLASILSFQGAGRGYQGGDISTIQQILAQYGYAQPVTGYYGQITEQNMIRLQERLHVSATGFFGAQTRAALMLACGSGTGSGTGNNPPPITNTIISGPTSLAVNQSGTWTVSTQLGSTVTAYVLWGDNSYSTNSSTGSSLTYAHSYTNTGTYTVRVFAVSSAGSIQTATTQIVISSSSTVGGITVTSPIQGQVVTTGSDLTIAWNYPVTPNSATMTLDLYRADGTKVGLIAVSNNTIGSYTWHVPPYPNTLFCTQQYPNGLCNYTLAEGQYYIRVSAVSGTGLETSPNVIASNTSGTFTIQHANQSFSVTPTSGYAPLTVTFQPGSYTGYYSINYGDGTSASLLSGATTHRYNWRGTYNVQVTSDALCLHASPACTQATQQLGYFTVTVF